MPTLTMTKGLPGSGKSTWAKTQAAKRINKDDLRSMIDDGRWSKHNEELILDIRDDLIARFISAGHNVIVDDTNLHPKHEINLKRIAEELGADFAVQDFTDVDIKECIKRDLMRPRSVGEKVIKDMYKQFLRPPEGVYTPPPKSQHAIICDIDGTLAHMSGRSPYDWKRVGEDTVDEQVREILRLYANAGTIMEESYPTKIVLLSGRESVCRSDTLGWLNENGVPYDELWMRSSGDHRKDNIVKEELFNKYVKDRYNVQFILDDRDQVVEMWRGLGLKVFQVAEGNF